MAAFFKIRRRGVASLPWTLLLFCFSVLFVPALLTAQVTDSGAASGTSNRNYRQQAAARIPLRQMAPAVAQQVANVVNGATIYRQLPITTIQSDPDMYLFLLRYPEAIISTWRLMGVSEMTAVRTAPFQLQAADGAGTTTNAKLIYGDTRLNVYYAEGEYEGPMLFRKVTGKCVIMVESDYQRDSDGKVNVTSRLNVFLKIDNMAAGIIAKTIHPLVGTTADHNFVETMKFAEKLSETSERNGPGVQRMAARLEGLRPEVRSRYMEVAGITWERAHGQVTTEAEQVGYNPQATAPPATWSQVPVYQHNHPPLGPHYHSIGDGHTWSVAPPHPGR